MTDRLLRDFLVIVAVQVGLIVPIHAGVERTETEPVTFTRDITPVLQRSCISCHRPGSIAPMSLVTYEDVRPWARAIKERIARAPNDPERMPPWFIEKNIGIQEYKDDISLTDDEIEIFAAWADAGAPRGNLADMPPPIQWADANEWTIGPPDLIVSTPVMTMPAVAPDYHGEFGPVSTGLTEDRYVKAVEVKEIRLLNDETRAALDQKTREGSGYGRFTIHPVSYTHLTLPTSDLV